MVILILFILIEYTKFFELLFSPLEFFKQFTTIFYELYDTDLIGDFLTLIIVLLGLISITAGLFFLLFPGVYLMIKHQKLIDKEWPDDPERTQKWREKWS